jgi:hypothetical protein
LPHAEPLSKRDALTNLRVVRDPASTTGWTLEIGPLRLEGRPDLVSVRQDGCSI